MARTEVIQIDSREQEPLLFPKSIVWTPARGKPILIRVSTERVSLPFGDYRLKRKPRCGVVERKFSLSELGQNLLSKGDMVRFSNAWARFVTGCDYPILLLDGSIHDTKEVRYGSEKHSPEEIMSAFFRLTISCPRLHVLWTGRSMSVPTRIHLGGEVLRMLIAAAEHGA